MNYRILIDSRAAHQLENLPKSILHRIDAIILNLGAQPRPEGVKRLRGKFHDGWRVRVGRYRVLYRIDDAAREGRIFEIGKRRENYR